MADESRERTSVEEFLAEVEAYIDEWFRAKLPFTFTEGVQWSPPTDVYETDDRVAVTMAIPGIRIEDLSVKFERGLLRVQGVRREPCGERRRYSTMEISVGPFSRRVRILRSVDPDGIKVVYADGLLRVTLPKARPNRVDVTIS